MAVPRRCTTARRLLSTTVRGLKTRVTSNVRSRPARARADCGSALMSLPKYSTVPRVGFNAPVTILMSVVFPAPFGPIRAVRAPTGSEKQMSDATVSAPNCLSRFLMARASTMTDPLAAQPRADLIKAVDDAAGHNQHDRDQHAADREHPAERVEFGGDMMDEHEQQGSDQRAPQPAGTAEDQTQLDSGQAVVASSKSARLVGDLQYDLRNRNRHHD